MHRNQPVDTLSKQHQCADTELGYIYIYIHNICAYTYLYTENVKTFELRNPSTLQKTREVNYSRNCLSNEVRNELKFVQRIWEEGMIFQQRSLQWAGVWRDNRYKITVNKDEKIRVKWNTSRESRRRKRNRLFVAHCCYGGFGGVDEWSEVLRVCFYVDKKQQS